MQTTNGVNDLATLPDGVLDTSLHTADGSLITYKTMTYFEERLPATAFIRVHRSFIVSLSRISAYSVAQLTLGKIEITIGSTYVKEVARKLNTFMG